MLQRACISAETRTALKTCKDVLANISSFLLRLTPEGTGYRFEGETALGTLIFDRIGLATFW